MYYLRLRARARRSQHKCSGCFNGQREYAVRITALLKNAAGGCLRTPRFLSCLLSLAQTAADFYVSSSVIASIFISQHYIYRSTQLALLSNCLQFKFYQENIVCIVNSQINFRYISAACDVSSYRELDETSFKTEDGETPCPRSGLLLLLCPLFSLCHLTLSATVSEIHSLQSTVQRELVTIPAAYCTIQTWSDPLER